ncbi:HlyD family secretion protein [Lacipirellula limnantheis]|uniref:HlyD family secretion protein n=2 Tax=Lacipirellula limnantheis TaxID=2528024 RepID=A0A517U5E9_9BACT|nr:HlyD family secretion protein [Lacipirellula limnantheis]
MSECRLRSLPIAGCFATDVPILEVMSDPPLVSADRSNASWSQLEALVERLHEAARSELMPREFFRRLLMEACAASGATAGGAWLRTTRDAIELLVEVSDGADEAVGAVPRDFSVGERPVAERRDAVRRQLKFVSQAIALDNHHPTDAGPIICAIADVAAGGASSPAAVGALEFFFRDQSSSALQEARRELVTTLASIAADYHALSELRRLRATAEVQLQAVDLLRRIQQPRNLTGTAFAVANEARRLLSCDRVALLLRVDETWRLLCVSGASRVDRQSEFARLSERLAEDIANWGEPILHEGGHADELDLPPRLASALADHLDCSHARQLAGAPIGLELSTPDETVPSSDRVKRTRYDAVLIAERFDGAADDGWQRQLVEIGELCAPSLARAATLDRFPVRTALVWSDRLAAWQRPLQRRRALWMIGAAATCAAALAFVPAQLSVEAPATLAAAVEREIFASATGTVAEIRVEHGQQVRQGDVLIVLSDPELALKLQQVRGEVDGARERLAALAVTRTDRKLADRETEDRLPLSAEQRQLEERLATLRAQEALLAERHEALTLRSPIAGEVLTPDVQSLLSSRPVERGQALLTIADVGSGWQLRAEVPQRDVGDVVEAQAAAVASNPPTSVAASFRLSGDVTATYPAHVVAIDSAAPLEADGLEDAAAPVQVRLAVDATPPAAARPGMAASVRIDCGRRSLGYVWLHDAAATIYRWITF